MREILKIIESLSLGWRRVVLWGVALLPVVVIVCFCVLSELYVLGMFVMHFIVMLAIPKLLVSGSSRQIYNSYLSMDFLSAQTIFVFLLVAVCSFLCYLPLRCGVAPAGACLDVSGFARRLIDGISFYGRIFLGFYFVLFNPIVEEFFWRTFLWRELGEFARMEETAGDQPAVSSTYGAMDSLVKSEISRKHVEEITIWPMLGLSVTYAAYHVVLFFVRANAEVGVGAVVGLTGLGVVLIKTREIFGFSMAVAVHAGVDLAAIAILVYETSS